jgi:hypothetical protein
MVVDNPIKAWPHAIYRQHLYRSSVLGHDTIYVMAPDLDPDRTIGRCG